MEPIPTVLQCPNCASVEPPRLIVRGNGMAGSTPEGQSTVLQCRSCHLEWSELGRHREMAS